MAFRHANTEVTGDIDFSHSGQLVKVNSSLECFNKRTGIVEPGKMSASTRK